MRSVGSSVDSSEANCGWVRGSSKGLHSICHGCGEHHWVVDRELFDLFYD